MDSGSTFFGPNALIMDGVTLSSAMHVRGINIRYLGRIVHLLLERERLVKENTSKIVNVSSTTNQVQNGATPTVSSVQNLPHFMTTIAMMELIARSAKHIYNPYIQVGYMVIIIVHVQSFGDMTTNTLYICFRVWM